MANESNTRPRFSTDEALESARAFFGLRADQAVLLPSDRDQNFLLVDEESGRRHVLKVTHSGGDPKVLDFQNRILEHLARAGFPTPKVIFGTDGSEVVTLDAEDGSKFFTRLLTWVPGTQLYRVKPQRPLLLENLGAFLGGMDRALGDFSHPAQDRKLKWDLKWAGEVVESHLEYVEDGGDRAILERMATRLLHRLSAVESDLRLSVIHADANDHNLLVGELDFDTNPDTRTVSGIVDFGDSVRSYTAGEVAIACAYAMLDKADPLTEAAHVVTGYNRAFPLQEAEVAALFPLMGLRLCASVAISAHQKRLEPENDYLTVSEAPAWALLRRLEKEIPELPTIMFRKACGLEPVPVAPKISGWLEAHGREAAAVVGKGPDMEYTPGLPHQNPLDLSTVPVHVFDLSGDSREFPTQPPTEDAPAWTRLLFGTMREARAQVGVGRYDEVRRWYTHERFRVPGDDPPAWRTVHLGVDLFLEPGSPVLTPFDAVVHSVADNAGSLDYGPTVVLEHRATTEDGETHRFWTLFGHLASDLEPRLYPGQPLTKGEAFARIGEPPTNGNWAPHLHFQVIVDRLGLEGTFPGVAHPGHRALLKAISPDPNLILRIPDRTLGEAGDGSAQLYVPGPSEPGRPSGAPLKDRGHRTREQILKAREAHLGPTLSIAYSDPLKIVRGKGQFLFDDEGQAYLDCVNNVPHVGHNHPRVVEAGQKQMALLNTNTRYLHDLLVDYADRLVATLPPPLSVVYFVCTGSEANELALRMARTHTNRQDVVVVDGAYHGNTSALVDMSPYKFDRAGGTGAPPWVHKTPIPDTYRGQFRAVDEEVGGPHKHPEGPTPENAGHLPASEIGTRYVEQIQEVLTSLKAQGREPSAFFCESMLGCGGQIVLPHGYMEGAFGRMREAGVVCVADEVQVGFGRAGSHFWAFETQGVVPDIVTLGKPMANGHPMAAVVTTPEIAASFTTGMEYFNTFGGNPVSCAIGLAVLDVIQDEQLQENARRVGGYLLAGLRELKERHPVVGDVRGLGLYLGVELVEDRTTREPAPERATRAKERLREHRILVSTDGPQDNVLKIKPPMVFTSRNADRLITTLDRILEEDGIRV